MYYPKTKDIHNPGRYERRVKEIAQLRQLVLDYLLTHPCVDCGISDPIVLEFDHVRGKKLFNISDGIKNTKPRKVLFDEIAKCEVRCANCHKRKTAKDYGWFKASSGSSEEEHPTLNRRAEIS